ncbi:MAG: hypothetical protein LUE31_00555 [Lachnospiraceae bacterium]|nr:hypothetical protein [Lachnospiraceae bacterium]
MIYLRSNRNTPDRMEIQISTPGQETLYEVRVMRLSDYTLERIFQKNLLFLLPFYIFTHEKYFAEYEKDDVKLKTLKEEYRNIARRLDELVEQGRINTFMCKTLMQMSIKVAENVAIKYDKIMKGVKEIMGGRILEYEAKTILREGVNQTLVQVIDSLVKNLGLSLEEVCRAADTPVEEYQRAKEILARK